MVKKFRSKKDAWHLLWHVTNLRIKMYYGRAGTSACCFAPHACEIEYCMDNLNLVKEYAWTTDDYAISETMQNCFANFIIYGNPNGDKLPNWPAAEPNFTTPPVMILDVTSKTVDAKDDARYEFLDKAYKNN